MSKICLVLLTCLVAFIFLLSACTQLEVKVEEKNIIELLSEQPNDNTAYCYVVSSDAYILKKDIPKLLEILCPKNWKESGKVVDKETNRSITINFNEFPEGKNAQNFDYNKGTVVVSQLVIQSENKFAFDGYSTKEEMYFLSSGTINDLQIFIHEKAVSKEVLIEKMK